jgi:hypothetical protein
VTNRAPLIIAIVLLLLPVVYVGSYLALVKPPGPFPSDNRTSYRVDSRWLVTVFWPLEQIDRKMRTGAWGEQ